MVTNSLESAVRRPRRLAVGEFDGVHLGHRAVIEGSDTVLTFDPHPRAVVGDAGPPALLMTLDQKREALEQIGVQELVVARFDEAFSRITAEDFITDILVGKLEAREVSIGANFRFGARATGTAVLLEADNRFDARVIDLVETDHGPVSSSRIRELIAAGDLPAAASLLGRPFEMRGEVVHGEKRGRQLGYPTANVVPAPGCLVPAFGIYACLANGMPAVASLGVRPTFESDGKALLEVHVLGFNEDLYGSELRVQLLERVRQELKFDSADELVEQMDRDSAEAAEICRSHSR